LIFTAYYAQASCSTFAQSFYAHKIKSSCKNILSLLKIPDTQDFITGAEQEFLPSKAGSGVDNNGCRSNKIGLSGNRAKSRIKAAWSAALTSQGFSADDLNQKIWLLK